MALINCTHCGKQMSDRVDVCPHCGEMPEAKKEATQEAIQKKKIRYLSLISMACLIISFWIWIGMYLVDHLFYPSYRFESICCFIFFFVSIIICGFAVKNKPTKYKMIPFGISILYLIILWIDYSTRFLTYYVFM